MVATLTDFSKFNSSDIKSLCLNFIMILLLASKYKDVKLGGLQFYFIKWLKKGHSN